MTYPRRDCLYFSRFVDDENTSSSPGGSFLHADCLDKRGRWIAEQRIWQILFCLEVRIGFWRI